MYLFISNIKEKMSQIIIDNIEISSDDSYNEDSDEENSDDSNKENSDEKI